MKGPVPWQLNCVTLNLNTAQPSVIMHCKLVVSTNLSQGMYRENRSRSNCSVNLYCFKSRNLLLLACSFSYICPPCQRNKPPVRKTNVTKISRTNEHLRTAGHRYKAREFKPYVKKRHMSDLYPYSLPGASVESIWNF